MSQVTGQLTLVPAYGRDYQTAEAVQKDWKEGKDFRIADISSRWNGSYTSIRDFAPTGVARIRYRKLACIVYLHPDTDADTCIISVTDPDIIETEE